MEIILKDVVPNLGEKDDLVTVKKGYALNYLIPQGLAVAATKAQKKVREENMRQKAHRAEKIKQEAEQLAENAQGVEIKIEMLVSKEGKLYGSVTPIQIHTQLAENGVEVDRRRITIKEEVEGLGSYTAVLSLHKEVKVELPFEVVEKAGE